MVVHAVSRPQMLTQGVADANSNAIIGHGLSFLVGRVSYTFGLQVGARISANTCQTQSHRVHPQVRSAVASVACSSDVTAL